MQLIIDVVASLLDRSVEVLLFPFSPENRLYWLYLLTSALAAYFVYRALRNQSKHATERDAEAARGSFFRFLFPKYVWNHPSAWLDLRYVFFHKIVSNAFLVSVGAVGMTLGYSLMSGGLTLSDIAAQERQATSGGWFFAILFMFVGTILSDFIAWFMHLLQHKSRILWQFHKVHHSPEVMHPISNFREHPIDNVAYGLTLSIGTGATFAASVQLLGYVPSVPTLLGVPLLSFLFNIVAYNLRHSHVWLRWPGVWSKVFPSPAHLHVHHSRHPDHIDKNFAFMFPVWDVIFGTYTLPADNRDVIFGVPEKDGRDLDTVLKLYWVPFRDAYRILAPKRNQAPLKSGQNQVDESQTRNNQDQL